MESETLNNKLRKIKVLAMDVDGTMTDVKVYYSKNGEELKKFSIRDGMGMELLHIYGIKTAIVTSESSQIVTSRANKLKINYVYLGSRNKKKSLEELSSKLNISLENIAFIGDDINDISAFKVAGVSACPNDSVPKALEMVDYVCKNKGGNGAIREFAELILQSQNLPVVLPENW